VQGFFGRDHAFYRAYAQRSRTKEGFEGWLRELVLEVPDRANYMQRADVQPHAIRHSRPSVPVDFGDE